MFGRGSSLAAGFIACVLSATCAWTANAADRACASEAHTSVPADRLDAMARGFNLNGWLDTDNGVTPDRAALAATKFCEVVGYNRYSYSVSWGRIGFELGLFWWERRGWIFE